MLLHAAQQQLLLLLLLRRPLRGCCGGRGTAAAVGGTAYNALKQQAIKKHTRFTPFVVDLAVGKAKKYAKVQTSRRYPLAARLSSAPRLGGLLPIHSVGSLPVCSSIVAYTLK